MPNTFNHVVLADDDQEDIDLYQSVITSLCGTEMTLTIARDGAELMQMLDDRAKPDLIILDVNMPRKNGLECLQEIRAKVEYNEVIIIVISTSDYNRGVYIKEGANYFVAKPVSFIELHDFVKSICDGSISDEA